MGEGVADSIRRAVEIFEDGGGIRVGTAGGRWTSMNKLLQSQLMETRALVVIYAPSIYAIVDVD
jgi:hypothetical protein